MRHTGTSEYRGSMTQADRARASVLDQQLCFALYAASRPMTSGYRPMPDALGLTRQRGDERWVVGGLTPASRALEERVATVQHDVSAATGLTEAEIVALRKSLHALTGRLRDAAAH
jgi:MarR family transcriptional regulator, organic hydroperoxide resistance regulator